MYRTPGRMFVPYKATSNMKQSIDTEAKTRILTNANGATEGAPMSKTIISGVGKTTDITPLHNLSVGFDVIGEEMPDIREMSHRDLLALEQKNNMDDDRKQTGKGMKVIKFCAQKGKGITLAGKGLKLAGKGMKVVEFCAQKGRGMYGRGSDLPSTFYNVVLPALLDHLNIPADSKTLKRLMSIASRNYEKTQDTKRLIEMVAEDYVHMLTGGNMSGEGIHSLNNKIKQALVKTMEMKKMTGAGIQQTFKKVIDTVRPYVKPAIEVGKWAYRNRDTIKGIASLVL